MRAFFAGFLTKYVCRCLQCRGGLCDDGGGGAFGQQEEDIVQWLIAGNGG